MAAGSGTTVARMRIEFLGDLKGYQNSLKQAKTEGDAAAKLLGSALKAAFKPPPGGYLAALKDDLELGRKKSLIVRDAAAELKKTLGSISVSALHTGLNGIGTVLGKLKTAAGQVFKGMLIGAGIAAFQDLTRVVSDLVHVIPDLITQGRDYGQMVADIVHATGASGESASKLAATIRFLDAGEVKNLVQLLGQFAKNVGAAGVKISSQEKILNKYDIQIRDTNGVLLNQVDALEAVRSGLSKMTDGTAKAGIIQALTGRGGIKVFNDYLRITDAQMVKLAADFKAQGLIITTEQAKLAEDSNRESRRLGNSLAGLGVQLFNIVGPQINAFLTTISNAITTHATEIASFVGGVISTILSFVATLTGATGVVDSFTASLGTQRWQSSAAEQQIGELGAELADLDQAYADAKDQADATTGATAAQTVASKAQTAAIEKEVAAVLRLDHAQDLTYKAGLASLNAMLDAQLKLMDAQDAAAERAQRSADLFTTLAAAQEALYKAEHPDTGKGEKFDQEAVLAARKDIAAAQAAIDANVRATEEADRRAEITSTKDYLATIDKIVTDADLSIASKKLRLKRQEDALRKAGAGTAVAGSDQAIELAAVLAAEKRMTDKATNDKKVSALQAKKDELAAETAEVRSAADIQYQIQRKALLKRIADAQKDLVQEKKDWVERQQAARRYGETISGPGADSVSSAFAKARKDGEDAAKSIILAWQGEDGKGGLKAAIANVADSLGHLFDALIAAWNTIPDPLKGLVAGAVAGGAVGGLPGAVIGAVVGSGAQLIGQISGAGGQDEALVAQTKAWLPTATFTEIMNALRATREAITKLENMAPSIERVGALKALREILALLLKAAGAPGHAAGGLAGRRGPELNWLGEGGGAEWVINAPALRALANLNRSPAQALSAIAGVPGDRGPIHVHVWLERREIANALEEEYARRPRR